MTVPTAEQNPSFRGGRKQMQQVHHVKPIVDPAAAHRNVFEHGVAEDATKLSGSSLPERWVGSVQVLLVH